MSANKKQSEPSRSNVSVRFKLDASSTEAAKKFDAAEFRKKIKREEKIILSHRIIKTA